MRPDDAPGLGIGVHGAFDDAQAAIVEDVAGQILEVRPDLVGVRLDLRRARSCSRKSLELLAALLERGASLECEGVGLDGCRPVRRRRTTTWMDVPATRAVRAG